MKSKREERMRAAARSNDGDGGGEFYAPYGALC